MGRELIVALPQGEIRRYTKVFPLPPPLTGGGEGEGEKGEGGLRGFSNEKCVQGVYNIRTLDCNVHHDICNIYYHKILFGGTSYTFDPGDRGRDATDIEGGFADHEP